MDDERPDRVALTQTNRFARFDEAEQRRAAIGPRVPTRAQDGELRQRGTLDDFDAYVRALDISCLELPTTTEVSPETMNTMTKSSAIRE